MRTVTVLGATGSIGDSTMDLLRAAPERYQVEALTANSNVEGLAKLGEINEGELDKLMIKMTQANSEAAGNAGVLTLDFSPRRSTKRDTSRS